MNSSDDSLSITETTPSAWAGGLALVAWILLMIAWSALAAPQ